jgi:hypothetical protein
MNFQYVYWDRDTTNWDSVYSEYEPVFSKLTNSQNDLKTSVSYFREITKTLIDGHFRIKLHHPLLVDSTITPSMDRKRAELSFHDQYNYSSIVKRYLNAAYREGAGNIVNNGTRIRVIAGTIDTDIIYFNCNFFALRMSYDVNDGNEIKNVLTYFFSSLQNARSVKGIIIDLRSNPGGDIADLNFIAGKLVNDNVNFGSTRSKMGTGKLDYLPWVTSNISHDNSYNVSAPIILLGDNFTASLAETFILALKKKDNCFFIGENTYGATGPLSDSNIFNSGSFDVGNFMSVETSSVEFNGEKGDFFEGRGIAPDIYVPFSYNKLAAGIDMPLERAIKKIKE